MLFITGAEGFLSSALNVVLMDAWHFRKSVCLKSDIMRSYRGIIYRVAL